VIGWSHAPAREGQRLRILGGFKLRELSEQEKTEIISRRWHWSGELNSGRYAQGKMSLHSIYDGKAKFCCLGVACNMTEVKKATGIFQKKDYLDAVYRYADSYDGLQLPTARAYMPKSVRRYFGISQDSQKILAKLNDSDVSFEVIAGILTLLPIEVED
jgi:hypothetical protein